MPKSTGSSSIRSVVPQQEPPRLEALRNEVLHAERLVETLRRRNEILAAPEAVRSLDEWRRLLEFECLAHELGELGRGRTLVALYGTRNLNAIREHTGTIAFSFHRSTPATQVRKLLQVYDRGRSMGDFDLPA